MNHRKSICMAMVALLAVNMNISAFALTSSTDTTFNESSVETKGVDTEQGTEYTENNDITSDETTYSNEKETEVYITTESTFSYILPKTITLDGQNSQGSYQVKVKGDISGHQKISIVPDMNFKMHEVDANLDKKNDVEATIIQEKTEWVQSEITKDEYSNTTGIITAEDISAGSWAGNFNFVVECKDVKAKEELQTFADQYFVVNSSGGLTVKSQYATYSGDTLGTTGTVTYCDVLNNMTDLYIPAIVGGKTVEYIEHSAFRGLPNVETIELEEGIWGSGYYAFADCSKLQKVILPDSYINMYSHTFENDTVLANVSFNGVITYASDNEFNNTLYKTQNMNDDGTLYFGNCLIDAKNATGDITIKNGTQTIANSACADNTNLTGVNMPDSMSRILASSFRNCSNLQNVDMSPNIKYFKSMCFDGCSSLKTIEIPSTTKRIEYGAFQNCTSANNTLVLPEGLTEIGNFAFNHCSSLKNREITIPSTLQKIGSSSGDFSTHAFYDCATGYLQNYIVAGNNQSFKTVDGVLLSKNGERLIAYPAAKDADIYIMPDTIKQLDEFSFSRAMKLKKIVLSDNLVVESRNHPDSVINFTHNLGASLYKFTGVSEIEVKETNTKYTSIDGILYSKDKTKLVFIPQRKQGQIIPPEECKEICFGSICGTPSIYNEFTEFHVTKNISKFDATALYILNTKASIIKTVDEENQIYTVENNKIVKK